MVGLRDVDATFVQIRWTLAGYRLGFAAGMITSARLGDIVGHKRVSVIGVPAFAVTSLLCGPAPGTAALVVFRVIQDLAAAATSPQVLAIMHVSFPEEKRAAVFGAFGAMTAGSSGSPGSGPAHPRPARWSSRGNPGCLAGLRSP